MNSDLLSKIKSNVKKVQTLCPKANLVAVTKYSEDSDIEALIQCGQLDLGENRVDQLKDRSNKFDKKIRWHMIGRIQRNKVKDLALVENLYAIHSVDRLSLIEELLKRESDFISPKIGVFFQVLTSGENEKAGFPPQLDPLLEASQLLSKSKKFEFWGLMTMGGIRNDDPKESSKMCFLKLSQLKEEFQKHQSKKNLRLSMGMSSDFELAYELGATDLRIGSMLFR